MVLKMLESFGIIILTEDSMARRMFTEKITRSDAFLDMPTSTQALYFHLLSEADDDGFVSSPKMVIRIVGANSDEIITLVNKKFVIPFDGSICVIKHWRMHNQVRKDRYEETKYKKEKQSLFIRGNGAYTNNPVNALPVPSGYFSMENIEEKLLATTGCQVDALGKGRVGKDSTLATPITEIAGNLEELKTNTQKDMAWQNKQSEDVEDEIQLDEDYSPKKKVIKKESAPSEQVYKLFTEMGFDVSTLRINKTERESAKVLFEEKGIEKIKNALVFYSDSNEDKYCPDVSTPSKLAEKWTALATFRDKK